MYHLYVQVSTTISLVTGNDLSTPSEISSSFATNRTNTTASSSMNPIRDGLATLEEGHKTSLTNHRLGVEESQENLSNNKSLQDFIPEASMLKPQLALQIIASSALQMNNQQQFGQSTQHQHQYQPQMGQFGAQQDANTRYLESDWPTHVNQNLDATIVVPSQSGRNQADQQHRQTTNESNGVSNYMADMNRENDQMQPSQSIENFDGPPLIEAKSNSELNSWRYVTDGLHGLPIQTIQSPRDDQMGQVTSDNRQLDGSNDDMRGQVKRISGGNIVVSMNLSGDEIIITPMTSNDDNGSLVNITTSESTSIDDSRSPDLEAEHNQSKSSNIGGSHGRIIKLSPSRRNLKAKNSSKQHITLELEDGQQSSASELVIVDNDDDDDEDEEDSSGNATNQPDNELDKPVNESERLNLARRTSKSRSNIEARSSPESPANQPDSELTRETRVGKGLSRPSEMAPLSSSGSRTYDEASDEPEDVDESEDVQHENGSIDEFSTEEKSPSKSSQSSSKRSKNLQIKVGGLSSSRDNPPRYPVGKLARKPINTHELKSRSITSSSRDNGAILPRDRLISAKRSTKTDNYLRKSITTPAASSIIVKGDDLRKFELLLESLRSISLDNLKASYVKHRQTPATVAARSEEFGDINNAVRGGSMEVHQVRPRHGKRASNLRPRGVLGPIKMASRIANGQNQNQMPTSDCSQKNQNQNSQLIADGTIVLQSQDPDQSASNVNSGSNLQTATFEIEESTDDEDNVDVNKPSGSDNQNDDNLLSLTTTETLVDGPTNQQNESNNFSLQGTQTNEPQFRPYFVRKTLLQNYQKSSDEANKINRGQDSYIDYNQLDNREVYRALDSPRQASRLVVTHRRADEAAKPETG